MLQEFLPLLGGLAAVLIPWLIFRVRPTKLASSDELDARIGQGKPVVLEFFSNL